MLLPGKVYRLWSCLRLPSILRLLCRLLSKLRPTFDASPISTTASITSPQSLALPRPRIPKAKRSKILTPSPPLSSNHPTGYSSTKTFAPCRNQSLVRLLEWSRMHTYIETDTQKKIKSGCVLRSQLAVRVRCFGVRLSAV